MPTSSPKSHPLCQSDLFTPHPLILFTTLSSSFSFLGLLNGHQTKTITPSLFTPPERGDIPTWLIPTLTPFAPPHTPHLLIVYRNVPRIHPSPSQPPIIFFFSLFCSSDPLGRDARAIVIPQLQHYRNATWTLLSTCWTGPYNLDVTKRLTLLKPYLNATQHLLNSVATLLNHWGCYLNAT